MMKAAFSQHVIAETKRCPEICTCYYPQMGHLAVECYNGWNIKMLHDVPILTNTL